MNIIKVLETPTVFIEDLEPGDLFSFEDHIYMRIKLLTEIGGNSPISKTNAVNLSTGQPAWFSYGQLAPLRKVTVRKR